MGGKPSQLLGPRAPLWQGGKKPLGEGDSFFDDAAIGAAVSLGVTAVDPARHPNIKRRLRLPVADEPAAAGALAARFEAAALFVHDARLAGDPVYVHCARGVSRSSAVSLAYALAARGGAFPTVAAARTWLEERRPSALPNVGFLAALEAWVADGGRDACAAKLRALEDARPAAAAALAASDAASVEDATRRAERRATEAVDDDDGGARRWMKVVKGARGDLGGRVEVVVDAPRAALQDAARAVADDVGGLWLPASRRVAREAVGALSPLRFSRDFVGASQPLIVRLDDVGPLDGLDRRPAAATMFERC